MTSSESDGQVTSRKRSRTSEDGGKEGKKARGRPRVEPQDATAADVSWLGRRPPCLQFEILCRGIFGRRKANITTEAENTNSPGAKSVPLEERNNDFVTQTPEHAAPFDHRANE